MAAKELITEIQIQASTEKVWQILTDFARYPEWNPFIRSLTGNVSEGNKIEAHIDTMRFRPRVLAFQKNREFRWLGHLFFPGIFDGEHRFQLIENADGSTRFIHSEKFGGILVGLLSKKLDTETKAGFEAMNKKLKEIAEK